MSLVYLSKLVNFLWFYLYMLNWYSDYFMFFFNWMDLRNNWLRIVINSLLNLFNFCWLFNNLGDSLLLNCNLCDLLGLLDCLYSMMGLFSIYILFCNLNFCNMWLLDCLSRLSYLFNLFQGFMGWCLWIYLWNWLFYLFDCIFYNRLD